MHVQRDSRVWIIRAPLLAALCALIGLLVTSLGRWEVVWPAGGRLGVFTDSPRVVGAALLEGGLAMAMLGWVLLVGSERHERNVILALVAATVAVAAGLFLMIYGFFFG